MRSQAIFPSAGFLLWAFLILAGAGVARADEEVRRGPVPDWVVRAADVPRPLTDEERAKPYVLVLHDIQMAETGRGLHQYSRQIFALNSRVAVETFTGLHIALDPERQRAVLHRIAIHRNGQTIDVTDRTRLQTRRVSSTLDAEQRADQALVSYVIPDLRAGDLVDMEASLIGDAAGLDGHFATEIEEKFGELPVALLRRRIVLKPPRKLHLDLVAGHPAPVDRSTPRQLVWEWEISDYKQPKTYADAPAWFAQVPAIRISDFRDWAEVVAWGIDTLRPDRRPSRRIRARARQIAAGARTPWEKLVAVLAYVQNNVRYLGDGLLARNGYVPLSPEDVASQGVGDCKDKTGLAIALLAALGVDAWPVLTNVTKGRIPRAIPTPFAFDHALLAVRVGNHDVWVDPTLRPLPDGTPDLRLPAMDGGLVLRQGETAIRKPGALPVAFDGTLLATGDPPLPGPLPDDEYETEIEHGLDLRTDEATLRVVFKGDTAAMMRMADELGARQKLEENFTAFLRPWLWNLKPEGGLALEADPRRHRYEAALRTKLQDRIWKPDGSREYLRLLPDYIIQLMDRVDVEEGRPEEVPIAWPGSRLGILERYVVRTPPDWKLRNLQRELMRDAYVISVRTSREDDAFVVTYRFRALRDHITPAEGRQLAEDRKLLKTTWSYWLWRSSAARRAGAQ